MKHLRYLRYILRHKWFVLVAGLKIGAPLWRLLVHDLSKLHPSEWAPYVDYFYGGLRHSKGVKSLLQRSFDQAWLHHQHRNPHHWQYWVLREDDGATKLLAMPQAYILEMVADWAGAGMAITGKWEVADWYVSSAHNMEMHPETRKEVERLLFVHFGLEEYYCGIAG